MKATRSEVLAWLACALVLAAMSGAFRPAGTLLAQYCAPPPDVWELHRIICRDRG
jgi:hypothetical protein